MNPSKFGERTAGVSPMSRLALPSGQAAAPCACNPAHFMVYRKPCAAPPNTDHDRQHHRRYRDPHLCRSVRAGDGQRRRGGHLAEGAVGRARGIRPDADLGPRHARRRRRRTARRVRGVARRRPRQRAGAARRDLDGRLAARASRDRGAGRADDDCADPRRRPYRAGRGHAARPRAAGAVRGAMPSISSFSLSRTAPRR